MKMKCLRKKTMRRRKQRNKRKMRKIRNKLINLLHQMRKITPKNHYHKMKLRNITNRILSFNKNWKKERNKQLVCKY